MTLRHLRAFMAVADELSANARWLSFREIRAMSGDFPMRLLGKALTFDGINDWVTVPDSASLDLTTGMTLEAWVKPEAATNWRTVIFKESAGGLAYALYVYGEAPVVGVGEEPRLLVQRRQSLAAINQEQGDVCVAHSRLESGWHRYSC